METREDFQSTTKGRGRAPCPGGEAGYVLITVTLLLVALLGFAALALDSGVLYSSRTQEQSIADAAALAGASTFIFNPTAPQPQTAITYATRTAVGQTILGDAVVEDEVTVTVNLGARRVTVDIVRSEETFLARALGIDSTTIGVRAYAEASPYATASRCAKPWFIPNSILLPSGATPCDACDPTNALNQQLLIKDGQVTAFALSQLGQQITIKPQNPASALAPAQFYAIQLGGETGADPYRTNIATCSQTLASCQSCYSVETGNMVGPTAQGVNDMIGSPADVFYAVGEYGPNRSDTSRSLMVAPIWDICMSSADACTASTFCPDGTLSESGTNVQLRIMGFVMLFLEGIQSSNVVARLINVTVCGSGGGPDPSAASTAFALPIRLVRVPEGS